MADKRRFLDVWIIDRNMVYREVPYTVVTDWVQQSRLLAEDNHTPQGSNVAVTCFADVPRAKELDAVQIVLSDPHYWGGVRQIQHLARL